MVTIRNQQMETLRQQEVDRFASNLVEHLLTTHALAATRIGSRHDLTAFVRRAIARVEDCGVHSPGGITVVVELLLQFGEEFKRSPLRDWALKILEHPTLGGDLKAEKLRERHEELTGGRTVISY